MRELINCSNAIVVAKTLPHPNIVAKQSSSEKVT